MNANETITIDGITYLVTSKDNNKHDGRAFYGLQKIGKRGKPIAQHFLADTREDGTISSVRRWF